MANLTLSFARGAPSSARPGCFPFSNCLSGPAAGLIRLVFHQERKSLCSQLLLQLGCYCFGKKKRKKKFNTVNLGFNYNSGVCDSLIKTMS